MSTNSQNLGLVLLCLSLASCAFVKREGGWGKDAFRMRAKDIGQAIVMNASDPHVWAPLVGAAALGLSKQDQKISQWASEETPIFGSKKTAHEESNELEEILEPLSYATLFVTRSWDENYVEYAFNKVKGGTVMYFANKTSHTATVKLKNQFKRERPNQGDHKSMPSGHSSRAATYDLLVRRNMAYSGLHPYATKASLIASGGITATIMWARVEAKMHYPSDTLVGYSLGHFVGGVFFDSLMNLDSNEAFAVYPSLRGDVMALYSMRF